MTRAHRPLALAMALCLAPLAVAQSSPTYRAPGGSDEPTEYRDRPEARDAYRRGYEQGFDRGFQKGLAEGERRGATLAPPPPVAPPPVAVPVGPIRMAGAFYGTSSKRCDASRYVRHRIDGKMSESFKVSNEMCGDPAHGDRKELEITYWCGPVSKSTSAREHQTIYVSCP